MSTSSNAGTPAGSAPLPHQADSDSTGGREASPGESGLEGLQGASLCNTAPHNSNKPDNSLPDGFRLLRLAVDSLYLSFPGDLHPGVLARLVTLKGKAQSPDPFEQSTAQFVAKDHIFEVKDTGTRGIRRRQGLPQGLSWRLRGGYG